MAAAMKGALGGRTCPEVLRRRERRMARRRIEHPPGSERGRQAVMNNGEGGEISGR